MSATNQSSSEDGPVGPRTIQLPSFRTFEAQLSRPLDHTSLELAPIRRDDCPLPPRPVATQLHPENHWQEYDSDKCTCSGDIIVHQHANPTPPAPIATHRYPSAVHRLPSPPPHHSSLTASSSRHPLSPPHTHRPSSPTRNRRAQGATSRPRWRPEERLQLFKAVSRDKELEQMSTFRWDEIAQQVGRSRKSCKDQWRREIYRTITEIFEHQTLSGRNLGFVPREHDAESMEEDSEKDHGSAMNWESE